MIWVFGDFFFIIDTALVLNYFSLFSHCIRGFSHSLWINKNVCHFEFDCSILIGLVFNPTHIPVSTSAYTHFFKVSHLPFAGTILAHIGSLVGVLCVPISLRSRCLSASRICGCTVRASSWIILAFLANT